LEAEQVLGVSVKEQNEITALYTSLVKQRRVVMSNPDRLESLSTDQVKPHLELIPNTENRLNNQKIDVLSIPYQKLRGTDPWCQIDCSSP
jgi:hypothetical protein